MNFVRENKFPLTKWSSVVNTTKNTSGRANRDQNKHYFLPEKAAVAKRTRSVLSLLIEIDFDDLINISSGTPLGGRVE